jgi:hypothetical protein
MQDETIWHKCQSPFFSMRTVHRQWTGGPGQTWRRKVNGEWQYQQDIESDEDWDARQY